MVAHIWLIFVSNWQMSSIPTERRLRAEGDFCYSIRLYHQLFIMIGKTPYLFCNMSSGPHAGIDCSFDYKFVLVSLFT